MTTPRRPYGLTPKDLEDVPAPLVDRRIAYVERYCAARAWPQDPALLTSAQLFEIINSEEWPK